MECSINIWKESESYYEYKKITIRKLIIQFRHLLGIFDTFMNRDRNVKYGHLGCTIMVFYTDILESKLKNIFNIFY